VALNINQIAKRAREICAPFIVTKGKKFRLRDCDPKYAKRFSKKEENELTAFLAVAKKALGYYQQLLYLDGHYGLHGKFQGRDAAGKGGAIKHALAEIDPRGYSVDAFGVPTKKERSHPYMWRCFKHTPARGRIAIFDRSEYEEVLVVKVHPEYLKGQMLPPDRIDSKIWKRRYETISFFEEYLHSEGIHTCKFLLHVTWKEQGKRLAARMKDRSKNDKVSVNDVKERGFWNEYDNAFEEMVRNTSTKIAPWVVVPADKKWFARLVVVCYMINVLDSLKLKFPKLSKEQARVLKTARRQLAAQKAPGKK
jgi:PPK2 family polyphosphate:nucleotide phosphotransferase